MVAKSPRRITESPTHQGLPAEQLNRAAYVNRNSSSNPKNNNAIGIAARYARNTSQNQQNSKQQPLQTITTPQKQRQDPLPRLQNNISRYVRTNDRRMMTKALKDCHSLRDMALDAVNSSSIIDEANDPKWQDLEDEICKMRITVNGYLFAGGETKCRRDLVRVLRALCATLTAGLDMSADRLYKELLIRLGRSNASADAHFLLNSILGCPDLIVQAPRRAPPAMESDLQMYASDGAVHVTCTTHHPFGLFRKADMSVGSKRPWVRLVAAVYERANLTNQQSVRLCTFQVQDK